MTLTCWFARKQGRYRIHPDAVAGMRINPGGAGFNCIYFFEISKNHKSSTRTLYIRKMYLRAKFQVDILIFDKVIRG